MAGEDLAKKTQNLTVSLPIVRCMVKIMGRRRSGTSDFTGLTRSWPRISNRDQRKELPAASDSVGVRTCRRSDVGEDIRKC
jgi:hypothetical protein